MLHSPPISSLERFGKTLGARTVIRTEGTGVFLDSSTVGVLRFVDEFAAYIHSLPERIVLLTFVPMNVSHVNKDRWTVAIGLVMDSGAFGAGSDTSIKWLWRTP